MGPGVMLMAERGPGGGKAAPRGKRARSVYHLGLTAGVISGARFALLPGDPDRVENIARISPFENAHELARKREFRTWLGYAHGQPALVTSTGIGGPSASIAVDELAQLGVDTFIRVGSTGAIQPRIRVGDVVITTGAVRMEGASIQYAPIEYPAVADHEVVEALIRAARELKVRHHVGITCSTDTFYPGQEREDSFSGYVPRHLRGITEEWRELGVLNYEMEAATILTLCGAMGLRGGCVTGVVDSAGGKITPRALALGTHNAARVAVAALGLLIQGWS